MEIPAEQGGVVKAVLVKVGDKIAQGDSMVQIEASAEAGTAPAGQSDGQANAKPEAATASSQGEGAGAGQAAAAPAPQAARYEGAAEDQFDVVVLGAGPGGYSAAFRAADLGLKVA